MTTFSAAEPGIPSADQVSPRDSTSEAPTSVARLNQTIKGFIDGWGSVWVEGEITSWNPRGGATFGRLKDLESDAQISIRVWSSVRSRLPADLKVGDHVIASVKADYYPRSGDLSFQVSHLRQVGLGEQLERLQRLRQTLRAEGLFDESRKRPLPFLPGAIGLITGEKSDAEKDVLRNAELRWPQVTIKTRYAAVQGDRNLPEVLAALAELDADPDIDVIIIARGGGDPQTLLGFSDERLVRAVAAATTPIVSAIGHENDHPILDDVADLRASTPTDAAKRVVPDVGEQRAIVENLRSRLTLRLQQRVAHDLHNLDTIRSRPAMRHPNHLIEQRAAEIQLYVDRGRDQARRAIDSAARVAAELSASLRALSPQATLARGYAIVTAADASVVRSATQAPAGSELSVILNDGSIGAHSTGSIEPARGS